MRIFLGRMQAFVYTILATAICLGCFWLIRMGNVSRLSALEGERTFFLDSASSQALIKTELSALDVFRIKGESVRFSLTEFDGGRYADKMNIDGQVRDEIAMSIAKQYNAAAVYKESACGIDGYYFYSTELPYKLSVNGKAVNLHVAVGKDSVAVGTPIIFGGF